MQRSALPLVLLAACLCPVLARPTSAAGRRLTQDGVDGAAPPTADGSGQSQFGSAAVDTCVQLTNSAGQACSVESDTSECSRAPPNRCRQLRRNPPCHTAADVLLLALKLLLTSI